MLRLLKKSPIKRMIKNKLLIAPKIAPFARNAITRALNGMMKTS